VAVCAVNGHAKCDLHRRPGIVDGTPLHQHGSQSQILVENRDFYLPQLHLTPSLGGFLSEYCHNVWYGKTRMVWLPEGEKFLKICLFVSTEYTNLTDGRTPHDGIGRVYA